MRRTYNSGEILTQVMGTAKVQHFFYGHVLHITNENLNRVFEIEWEDESHKESACPLFCGEMWQLSTLGNHASGNSTQTYSLDLFNSKSTIYFFLSFHRAFCRLFNCTRQQVHIYIYAGESNGKLPPRTCQDAVCQSHTGHMTGLWFLPSPAFKAEY